MKHLIGLFFVPGEKKMHSWGEQIYICIKNIMFCVCPRAVSIISERFWHGYSLDLWLAPRSFIEEPTCCVSSVKDDAAETPDPDRSDPRLLSQINFTHYVAAAGSLSAWHHVEGSVYSSLLQRRAPYTKVNYIPYTSLCVKLQISYEAERQSHEPDYSSFTIISQFHV